MAEIDDIYNGKLPFATAQAVFAAGRVNKPSGVAARCGWYGTSVNPEIGCFAVCPSTGKFADLIGERLKITYARSGAPRVAYVYLLDYYDDLEGVELAVARPVYVRLAPLGIGEIPVWVETIQTT